MPPSISLLCEHAHLLSFSVQLIATTSNFLRSTSLLPFLFLSYGANAQGGASTPQQLVVVCGKNKKVKADLEAKAEAHHWGPGVDVVVKGFIGNMEEYMSAADCIVTKVWAMKMYILQVQGCLSLSTIDVHVRERTRIEAGHAKQCGF